MNIPSGRPASKTHSSPGFSPCSKEEAVEAAPLILKRNRSSPEKKSSTTSGANFEKIALIKTTSSVPEIAGQSRLEQIRRAPSSSTPSTVTTSAPTSSSAQLSSVHIPSPDTDDHLTLKKLKVLHSQESKSP